LLGQLDQQGEGLVGHPVLGVVQVQPGGLGGQPDPPLRVSREQVTQMPFANVLVVLLQRLPRGALSKRWGRHRSFLPVGSGTAGRGPARLTAPQRSVLAPGRCAGATPGTGSPVRKSIMIVLHRAGFSCSRKCDVPGTTASSASGIPLYRVAVSSRETASASPAISSVRLRMAPRSAGVSGGSPDSIVTTLRATTGK